MTFKVPIGECESGFVYLDWLSKKVWLVPRAVLYTQAYGKRWRLDYLAINLVFSTIVGLLTIWGIFPKIFLCIPWISGFFGVLKSESYWKHNRPNQKIQARYFDFEDAVGKIDWLYRFTFFSFILLIFYLALISFSFIILVNPFIQGKPIADYALVYLAIVFFGAGIGVIYSFLIGSANFFTPLAIDYIRAHKKELFNDKPIEYQHKCYVGTQVLLENSQKVTVLGVAGHYDHQYPERTHDYVGLLCEPSEANKIKLIYFNEEDIVEVIYLASIEEWEKEFQERLLISYPRRRFYPKKDKEVTIKTFKNSLFGSLVQDGSSMEIGSIQKTITLDKVIVVQKNDQSVIVALLEDRYVEEQFFLEIQ